MVWLQHLLGVTLFFPDASEIQFLKGLSCSCRLWHAADILNKTPWWKWYFETPETSRSLWKQQLTGAFSSRKINACLWPRAGYRSSSLFINGLFKSVHHATLLLPMTDGSLPLAFLLMNVDIHLWVKRHGKCTGCLHTTCVTFSCGP